MKAICQSVFAPRSLPANEAGYALVTRYGWLLIVVRWTYYSVLFQFRDYGGKWAMFVPPPFRVDVDTYARLQRSLSLPFGIVLMLLLALALVGYLRLLGKHASFATTLNILGTTFFLPFVLAQPLDQAIMALVGWRLVPVTLLHTAILAWESWAAVEVLSASHDLRLAERLGGIAVLGGVWIGIAGSLWR